jgi:integrase
MPEITFHGLRHTHASQLIDAGLDIVTISKRLGHASPDVTLLVCAHLFRRDETRRLPRSMPPWQARRVHDSYARGSGGKRVAVSLWLTT